MSVGNLVTENSEHKVSVNKKVSEVEYIEEKKSFAIAFIQTFPFRRHSQ